LIRLLLAILVCSVPIPAQAAISLGSGFFITSDGYFVTSNHVIEKATTISIRDSKGTVRRAAIAAKDSVNDLSILKVEGTYDALPIANSRATKPGARVVTMGFPLLNIQGQEPKITDGIVNSTTGIDNDPRMFQISVSLQPGNSGGALVDGNGNVIGVVTAKLDSLKVLRETGDLPQNVNYATKSNYLLEVVSGVDGLEAKLPPPRPKPLPDLERLAELLSRSIGLVVAQTREAAAPATPSEPVRPVTFPRIWKSLTSGSQFSIRLDEPYLQWVQLSSVGPQWVSGQGEAKRNGESFSGSGSYALRNSATQQTCVFRMQFTFSSVSPRRIEGESIGIAGRFSWDSCQQIEGGEQRSHFVWVPQ
jgi:hypothetical protein